MSADQKQTEEATVCESCGGGITEDAPVIQVVRDRHPTYDSEIVLSTHHTECWEGRESQLVQCRRCRCTFRLVLLKKGEDYQNLSKSLLCPFCGTPFDSRMGF